MEKKTYRLILFLVLCLAVGAGVFYYQSLRRQQNEFRQGTFVYAEDMGNGEQQWNSLS